MPRPPSPMRRLSRVMARDGRSWRPACAVASVLLALAAPLAAQVSTAPDASLSPKAAPSAASKELPELSEVVIAAARADALRREIESTVEAPSDWTTATAAFPDIEARVEEGLRMLRAGELSTLRFDTLVDVDSRVRERERSVGEATRALRTDLSRLERDIDRLDREIAAWPDRVKAAVERQAPEAILERAKTIEPGLATVRESVRRRRDELLLAFDRGTRLMSNLDTLRAAIATRRDQIGRRLRVAEEAPLWSAAPRHEDHGVVQAEFRLAREMLVDYLRNEAVGLLLAVVAIAGVVAALLRQPSIAGGAIAQTAGGWPIRIGAGLLVAFVFIVFSAPIGPTAFYPLWWFPVPLLAAWIADRMFDVHARATLWALGIAGSLNTFNTVAELQPGAARALLVFQLVVLGAAIVADARRRALERQLARWHPITVRVLALGMLATLMASLAANVIGLVGVARVLRGVAITATSSAMVFVVTAALVERAIVALLARPVAQRLRSVREQADAVRRFLIAAVWIAAAVGWVLLLLYTQNLVDNARAWVQEIERAKISVREVEVSAGGILLAALIVLATSALVRLVRFVLTIEILPRFGLRPGVPYAIATITGYVLAVLGMVLALAAVGVDLTKVTLLAGALGVGIGFGLQNIVNNFVSGLILVMERPIKVGDQVEIGELLGDVRRIGIRSSTVRTVQGAEVIVPNSDLVSKQVVNWTLSDRSRRYEIDVGVAYGSDVDRVMKLLEDAAARVPDIKKVPPPRVLFAGFGDSSLDFRVLAWVESVDVGLQAQNALRREILAALNGAGVEIPYPQRDLHIRSSAPPGAGPAAEPA